MMLGWVLPHCSHPLDAPSCLIASKSVRRPSASPHPHLHSPRPTLSVGSSVRDFAVVSLRLVAWTVPALKTSQASQSRLVNFRKGIRSQHLSFHDCWFLSEYSKVSFLESQNREVKMRRNLWKSINEFNALTDEALETVVVTCFAQRNTADVGYIFTFPHSSFLNWCSFYTFCIILGKARTKHIEKATIHFWQVITSQITKQK